MASIRTSRADVIWNYVGTVVSMASGFVLLPLLMRFLTPDELGLWYVFVAVSNLAMLFEFGFNPTFARNIVYVVSGARRLTREGCDFDSVEAGIDWHLLKTVIRASRLVYAAIAVAVALALSTLGTLYVGAVSSQVPGVSRWVSWAVFVVSVFLNLYFLYSITLLRGYGDVAGENRAKTFARLAQLAVSALLMLAGWGLVGASLGYLANGVLLRVFASLQLRRHDDVRAGLASDRSAVTAIEVRAVLATVGHVAWRDGLVQLACYASTQAMSIVGSLTLGLAETGTYSVLLQFGNAVYNFAGAYPKSFFPAFQAAHASHDIARQREIVSEGVVAYWSLFMVGVAGVALAVMPLLPLVKEGFTPDLPLFLALCLYLGLWNQHSIFCNYIVGMNEIPYVRGYVLAALVGAPLSYVLSGPFGWGAWGLVAGQALSQAAYNNWRWPMYLAGRLDVSYRWLLRRGVDAWSARLRRRGKVNSV